MRKNKLFNWIIMGIFLLLASSPLYAEDGSHDTLSTVIQVMIAITVFFVIIVLWLVMVYSEKNDAEGSGLKKFFGSKKPVSVEEEEKLLLDHEYDGIRELNNRIPPWFNAILYGTVVWAAAYMIYYHVIGSGNVQEEEYAEEMRVAAMQHEALASSGALIDENTVTITNDVADLNKGKEIFDKNCAACHGVDGGGIVGPNLTDNYWIHGNDIKDLFKVVKYGVAAKGMPTWEKQLTPKDIQDVTSYILVKLHGTKPANGKAPEGDLYE